MIQCPKCKKINRAGKFIDFKIKQLIPGIRYKLCDDCRAKLNRLD